MRFIYWASAHSRAPASTIRISPLCSKKGKRWKEEAARTGIWRSTSKKCCKDKKKGTMPLFKSFGYYKLIREGRQRKN